MNSHSRALTHLQGRQTVVTQGVNDFWKSIDIAALYGVVQIREIRLRNVTAEATEYIGKEIVGRVETMVLLHKLTRGR